MVLMIMRFWKIGRNMAETLLVRERKTRFYLYL